MNGQKIAAGPTKSIEEATRLFLAAIEKDEKRSQGEWRIERDETLFGNIPSQILAGDGYRAELEDFLYAALDPHAL